MIVKLLTEHNMGFVSLKGGCRGSSESTLVKKSNCWKSHALAHLICETYKNILDILTFLVFLHYEVIYPCITPQNMFNLFRMNKLNNLPFITLKF